MRAIVVARRQSEAIFWARQIKDADHLGPYEHIVPTTHFRGGDRLRGARPDSTHVYLVGGPAETGREWDHREAFMRDVKAGRFLTRTESHIALRPSL